MSGKMNSFRLSAVVKMLSMTEREVEGLYKAGELHAPLGTIPAKNKQRRVCPSSIISYCRKEDMSVPVGVRPEGSTILVVGFKPEQFRRYCHHDILTNNKVYFPKTWEDACGAVAQMKPRMVVINVGNGSKGSLEVYNSRIGEIEKATDCRPEWVAVCNEGPFGRDIGKFVRVFDSRKSSYQVFDFMR